MREYALHQAQQTGGLPHRGILIELWRYVFARKISRKLL